MANSSKQARTELDHDQIATFTRGGSLAPKRVVREATDDMGRKFSAELAQRYKEDRKIGDSLRKINAPLAEIMNKDKSSVNELRKLRARLSKQVQHRPAPLQIPQAHSAIKPGSIVTVLAPPYEHPFSWVDPNNTGRADAGVDIYTGTFGGDAWSDEGPQPSGYGQAAAGFGVGFHPTSEVLLYIGYQLMYDVSWYESSSFEPAHTNGQSQIIIYQYDLKWNFQRSSASASASIWTDRTILTETHAGGTSTTESFLPQPWNLFMSPESNYIIWFIGRWHADGAGDPNGLFNSQARCWLNASLPYVVLEYS
jgi:hypothetical protein